MPATATAIHFPSRDAGKTNTRSFSAPDRAIAIPHPGGCAGEGLAHGLGRGGGQEKQWEYQSKNSRYAAPLVHRFRGELALEAIGGVNLSAPSVQTGANCASLRRRDSSSCIASIQSIALQPYILDPDLPTLVTFQQGQRGKQSASIFRVPFDLSQGLNQSLQGQLAHGR